MTYAVLLNGPPRCGKDTIGAEFIRLDIPIKYPHVCKFARILKERTHALYGLFDCEGFVLAHDAYEPCKDMPLPEFLGLTPRQAYIEVSEGYFKRVHGKAVFGTMLADSLPIKEHLTVIVTDSGFVSEAEVLIERFGRQNVLLVRISRPGTDFSGDSRGYLTLPAIRTLDVHNDSPSSPFEIARRICEILPMEYRTDV